MISIAWNRFKYNGKNLKDKLFYKFLLVIKGTTRTSALSEGKLRYMLICHVRTNNISGND